MKVLVADDKGALKNISVTKGSVASNPASIPPDIKIFDRNDRSRYIQAMTLVTWNGRDNLVCIARKGGSVDIMDPETGETLKVIEEHKGHEDAYVSMEYRHGILSNCTASGNAFFQNLCYTNRFVHSLPNPVSVMRVHPTIPGIIAFGGKEQDLSIWVSDPDEDEESNEGLRESIIFQNFRPTWKAKNVKNDELDLRVPVWVSDVQFLQCSTVGRYKIVCVTRFHQVRIYDTQMARRPIMSVEVGEYPISSMILGRTPEEVIFADTHSNVLIYSMVKKMVIGSYKGASGAVTAIAIPEGSQVPILATGGLDATMRIFDLQERTLLSSVYCSSKITCLIAFPEVIKPEVKDETEEEDVWDGIEEITETSHESRVKRQRRA